MMKHVLWWIFVLIVTGLTLLACGTTNESVSGETGAVSTEKTSGKYTSSFPGRNFSSDINTIFRSVKRISSTASYSSYYFGNKLLTFEQLRNRDLGELATQSVTRSESVAGTAISIARDSRGIALLTCAHVVHYPDTLVEYVSRDDLPEKTYVSSIAVRRTQRNLLFDLPRVEEFEIIDKNVTDDLALIRFDRERNRDLSAPPLNIGMGNSKNLDWGSFILIAGYPKGFPMIVDGLVSDPNRNSDGDFLTNALFNPGISGGLILASRNRFRSFEWVGVANTATAEQELLLVPDPSASSGFYQPLQHYRDTPFIDEKTSISYGITQAIPTSKIIKFLDRNHRMLYSMGLDTDRL